MNILLAGKPRSGKTTMLQAIVNRAAAKQGFVTEQVLKDGVRTGFELVSAGGSRVLLTSVDSKSIVRVSKYGVDVASLDVFVSALPAVQSGALIYADEIGQMELFSEKFKALIGEYLATPNPYIGTITSVYEDDFTRQVLGRKDIIVIEIKPDNRAAVEFALDCFVKNLDYVRALGEAANAKAIAMARTYVSENKFLQLKKLFGNALQYVAEGRVVTNGSGQYAVAGNHGEHTVRANGKDYRCDCRLFMGEGGFTGNAEECSHIQSVRLFSVSH